MTLQLGSPKNIGLFYQPPNDGNFYNVNYKVILQSNLQNSENLNEDYEFFFHYFTTSYHVTCKLLPHSLIVKILNKESYGINFDVNDLKRKHILTFHQKLNLEQNLKQILPLPQSQIIRNTQPQQALQVDEFRIFYQPPDDDNFYHITCKMIALQVDDDYNYEFFYQSSNNLTYHVTCKLLPYSLIINILNKKIYGWDLDVNDSRYEYMSLSLHQKLNLEQNLKQQVLPHYLCIFENEMRSGSDENTSSIYENIESNTTETIPTVDGQSYSTYSDNEDTHQVAYQQQ